MIPWETLDRARAPGGAELTLHRRGSEYVIRVDGQDLMGSRQHGSERSLAELGCAQLVGRSRPRVLIGGLGMGFTLRAALDVLPGRAEVHVCELVPAVVQWNRGVLGALAGEPLSDARVTVIEGDVAATIAAARDRYDAILLDVDNGPDALTAPANAALYGASGLKRTRLALTAGGVLAVWSAADDARFTKRLSQIGYDVRVERPLARERPGRRGGKRHVLWIAGKRDH